MTNPSTLEDRRQFIGASDVGAILGKDPYRTRLQVYEEKVGLALPFAGNQHTRRGNRLENVAVEVYQERYPERKVYRYNERLRHPVHSFITGRIDRRVVGMKRVLEIKVPSLGMFSKIKRTGLHEGYICQLQTYTGLMGYDVGEWALYCPDQDDLITFPIEFDPQLYNDIIDRCVSFWNNYVVPRVPPPADDRDEELIEVERAAGSVSRFDMSGDDGFLVAAELFRRGKELEGEAKVLLEEARTQVLEHLAMPFPAADDPPVVREGVYIAPGVRLTYTMSKGRASFDKKALIGAKPLDRLAVGAILNPLWQANLIPDDIIKQVGDANLDLAVFESTGKPFPVLRATFGGMND